MNETLAICLPGMLLFLVSAGYLVTVFEPYFAQHTAEAEELKRYYQDDAKLRIMAEWWAAKLGNSIDGWYDDMNEQQQRLFAEVYAALLRHRFLSGDDPGKLCYVQGRPSSLLLRALRRAGHSITTQEDATMLIEPNTVKISGGKTIWRGRPQEYRSRFNDMYDIYAES